MVNLGGCTFIAVALKRTEIQVLLTLYLDHAITGKQNCKYVEQSWHTLDQHPSEWQPNRRNSEATSKP